MRLIKWLALFALTGLLVMTAWLWLTMLSPWTYERPEDLERIGAGPHRVFVYGTLRHAPVRWLVMGRAGETEPAVLEDVVRNGLDLASAPGERVAGEVLVVGTGELYRLDRYERLGIRYERVKMTLEDGREAWVYRRLEEPATETARL
jgi:gamma-glutamylcyclotransferase (GGCT)/AIG2-like uncharacterized protein YtfP